MCRNTVDSHVIFLRFYGFSRNAYDVIFCHVFYQFKKKFRIALITKIINSQLSYKKFHFTFYFVRPAELAYLEF